VKRSQLLILAVAVIAVLAAVLVQQGEGDDPAGGGGGGEPRAPKGAIAVSFLYSPEKEELLKPLIARCQAAKRDDRSACRARAGRVGELPAKR
jgi:Ca-activated chloride channel family protein